MESSKESAAFLPEEIPTWYIVEVASDRSAMVEALAEYGYRMLMEHGASWGNEVTKVTCEAKDRTIEKLADELKQKRDT